MTVSNGISNTNGRSSPIPSEKLPHLYDASGHPIPSIFDSSGHILSLFDASGHIVTNVFDASGKQLSSITDSSRNIFDVSGSTVVTTLFRSDVSWNLSIDSSGHVQMLDSDASCSDISFNIVPIVSDLSYSVVDGPGYEITNQKGTGSDGSKITRVTFTTTDPSSNPQIYENLTESIISYNDETDPNSQTDQLLNQIRTYAAEIKCSDFHGKGSIDDYQALFQAASKIATESKQMELNVDIEGFNEFASAADDLSELFQGFILKLQNVNIITDLNFLKAISNALAKIVNLSNIFGKFKQAVFDTTTIQLPQSAHDTTIIIKDVMDEVNCAMNYINYFVDPESNPTLSGAELTPTEQNIIAKSVDTINNWNTLCEYGVSIAMSSDTDVQYIEQASNELKQSSVKLTTAATKLRAKLAAFNITC